jgi:acyl-CoA synthetase (NDP forming)
LGVISQSGSITQRLTEQTCSLGLGVDKAVSFGNGTVLDSTDYLGFMGGEKAIRVIAMYLESIREARVFFSLAREINKVKPIVLWKGGETVRGSLTAASHTGSLSGERLIWEAFFRQTGVIRVHSMEEWADALLCLAHLPAPGGKGVFLVGGGGGNSVTNSDICIGEGLDVPHLSRATMDSLEKSVPKAGSIAGNPLDMFRVFQDTEYLGEVLDLAYHDPNVSMIIVDRLIPRKAYHLPYKSDSTPETIALLKKMKLLKPTVFTIDTDGGDPWLAEKGAALRAQFCTAGIPAYPSLKRAARALAHLYRYHSHT